MTAALTLRRLATRTALLLWPPFTAAQEVVRNDLFEDAATIALTSMHAKGDESPLVNRDAVLWTDAELPPLGHRCRATTAGYSDKTGFVYRCACGAIRGDGMFAVWVERNTRRR